MRACGEEFHLHTNKIGRAFDAAVKALGKVAKAERKNMSRLRNF
jgi:hypothetical protein